MAAIAQREHGSGRRRAGPMASTPRRRHHCHHDHQPRTHRARAHRADGRLEDSLECYTLMNFLLIGLRYGGLSVPRSKYIIGCHVMSAHDVGGAIAACSNCTYSTHTVLMSVIIRPPAFCTLSQSAARTSASSQQLLLYINMHLSIMPLQPCWVMVHLPTRAQS